MSDDYIELLYYALGILFISIIASFFSKKCGVISSSTITIISIISAFIMTMINFYFLFFGLLFFPALTWFGFWLGRFIRKRYPN